MIKYLLLLLISHSSLPLFFIDQDPRNASFQNILDFHHLLLMLKCVFLLCVCVCVCV
ncbi:hypothetical protein ABFX02_12G122300 [Erythranthe guttata]